MAQKSAAPVDDRYLTGVWYNGEIGEFEQYDVNGDEVKIYSSDGELLDTVEFLETGALTKVESKAVENPVEYYEEIIDWFHANNLSANHLPHREEISFMYARQQIKVVEKE